jgi:hypothetical protein
LSDATTPLDVSHATSESLRPRWWRLDPTPELGIEEVAAVADRVRDALAGTRADSTWVKYRFEGPLLALLRGSYSNARTHFFVNMAVIVGGFATSGIAVASGNATTSGSNGGHNTLAWVVFAIGLLVALSGGISQIFRPGQRSTGRSLLAAELLNEGWALDGRHGIYKASAEPNELFILFDRRIGEIRGQAFQLGVLDDSGPPKHAPPSPGHQDPPK